MRTAFILWEGQLITLFLDVFNYIQVLLLIEPVFLLQKHNPVSLLLLLVGQFSELLQFSGVFEELLFPEMHTDRVHAELVEKGRSVVINQNSYEALTSTALHTVLRQQLHVFVEGVQVSLVQSEL